MTLRIDRTRMAMNGRYYAYDAVVPASEVDCTNISYYILRDGGKFVVLADATRPSNLNDMPLGIDRYEAWKEHEKACNARILEAAKTAYPELEPIAEWPTLFMELPELEAPHAHVEVTI